MGPFSGTIENMQSRYFAALTTAALSLVVPASAAFAGASSVRNPSREELASAIAETAQKDRIPTVLLEGLAWHESGWRQWDAVGKPVSLDTGRVGLLGVSVEGRKDADRLRSDWRYNLDEGAKDLVLAWNRAPRLGITGKLDDWRNVLESWYFAVGRYGRGARRTAANAYADSVFDSVASGGEGRWEAVRISRLSPQQLAEGLNVLCPPAPWHFGDVPPRPEARTVVSLNVPYLNQVYDDPAGFDKGGGACGPTSMVMVLAYYHQFAPKPTPVAGWYNQPSLYGAYLPEVYSHVCEPGVGAVHAKMLDYLRPHFPGVAIFYNEKATPALVKAELDAGRPCIIGTEVTSAGHIMVVRGYLSDGRLLVCDPAGDRERAARAPAGGPLGDWSKTGVRYWNGEGGKAVYDWDALQVRWVMTLGPNVPKNADVAEDGK